MKSRSSARAACGIRAKANKPPAAAAKPQPKAAAAEKEAGEVTSYLLGATERMCGAAFVASTRFSEAGDHRRARIADEIEAFLLGIGKRLREVA